MNSLCRLCATCPEPSELVTEIGSLESKLAVCCGWKPSEKEIEMPQKACTACFEELDRSWNLVERIREAETKLCKMLSEKPIPKRFEEPEHAEVKLEAVAADADSDSFDVIEPKVTINDDKADVPFAFGTDGHFGDDDDEDDVNVFGEPVNYLESVQQKRSKKSRRPKKEQQDDGFLSKLTSVDFLSDGTISKNGIQKLTNSFPDMKTMSWNDCQYKCTKCDGRILKGAQVLYAHVRSIHVDELMSMKISCFYCNFKHRREYIVNQHIATEHFVHLKYL